MFTLKKAIVNKYKSYTQPQEVSFEEDITTLVGKNESGKTAFLEALAKFNYFTDDPDFEFDATYDYPRRELTRFRKSKSPVEVIKCTFEMDNDSLDEIKKDVGDGIFTSDTFQVSIKYDGGRMWSGYTSSNERLFIDNLESSYGISESAKKLSQKCKTLKEFIDLETEDEGLIAAIKEVKSKIVHNAYDWDNLLDGYIIKQHLKPNLPRFWYFDEYHELPSRISIEDIKKNSPSGGITQSELETAKSLFELANIDVDEILQSEDFESFVAELEATSNDITDKIFEYWSTNDKLEIVFAIESKHRPNSVPEKILDIRVKNNKNRVSLPLKSRSKGFNWFFSFIVWFSKIQDEKDRNFILLLDEPGLNLHASAQNDLLRFIDDLSDDYQIVYTTHSPFMVDSTKLHRVRTVYDADDGSIISDVIQEKDPDTLFPLQAALGYDIAQNLFVSKNNLLVEGPADLNYLTYMSNILENMEREGLRDDITVVPVGGLDKVTSFISLLRGSKLKISCLLDSFNNTKGAQRIDSLIQSKIIKEKQVRFFDEFAGEDYNKADIEDMFEKSEYLEIFKNAFPEHNDIKVSDLDDSKPTILQQLKALRKGKDFNHYKPSQLLLGMGLGTDYFSDSTLNRFESMFSEINKLY